MLERAINLLQRGEITQAHALLTQYTIDFPHDAQGFFLLAAAAHQSGKHQNALTALEQVFSLAPRHPQASNLQAIIFCELYRFHDALEVYREALQWMPDDASLRLNFAITLEMAGDNSAALGQYDSLLQAQPDQATILLNRGALLLKLGHLQEALNNNSYLAKIHTNWIHAHFNLGESLLALELYKEAVAAYTKALELQSDMAKAHLGRGLALSMLQRFIEAEQDFLSAQSLDPGCIEQAMRDAAILTGGVLYEFTPQIIYILREVQKINQCEWKNWATLTARMESLIGPALNERALIFNTFSLPLQPESRLKLARSIATRINARVPHKLPKRLKNSTKISRKIKLGYVSPDFRQHPAAMLTRRLYALHDRNKFEVYGYSLKASDDSSLRLEIEQGCDFFREISHLDDRTAAEIIYNDGIDILIDLAGYTSFSRSEIFTLRPAPLQLSYLGFPHTTGADFIDYFIADSIVIPPTHEAYFSEKIVHLPNSYFIFDNQQTISPTSLTRANFNLPSDAFVFCCHNALYKITPDVFDRWMSVLRRVPGSVLWLLKGDDTTCENLRKEATLRDVASERLIFADYTANDIHLARFRLADLFLDTFHYNAHTTAAEALWAGLPVLTCQGETMAARVASSLLTAIGLPEMITTSQTEYEDRAVHLATHKLELEGIRKKLENNRLTTPLFNTEQQVKNIENIYESIWDNYKVGLKADNKYIQ
jgi:predicted O-linked N-acetylglucosamine transferase (SPINDLY family)